MHSRGGSQNPDGSLGIYRIKGGGQVELGSDANPWLLLGQLAALVLSQKGCRCNRVDLIRLVEAGRLWAEVVLMARQREAFVRVLKPEEAQRPVKISN